MPPKEKPINPKPKVKDYKQGYKPLNEIKSELTAKNKLAEKKLTNEEINNNAQTVFNAQPERMRYIKDLATFEKNKRELAELERNVEEQFTRKQNDIKEIANTFLEKDTTLSMEDAILKATEIYDNLSKPRESHSPDAPPGYIPLSPESPSPEEKAEAKSEAKKTIKSIVDTAIKKVESKERESKERESKEREPPIGAEAKSEAKKTIKSIVDTAIKKVESKERESKEREPPIGAESPTQAKTGLEEKETSREMTEEENIKALNMADIIVKGTSRLNSPSRNRQIINSNANYIKNRLRPGQTPIYNLAIDFSNELINRFLDVSQSTDTASPSAQTADTMNPNTYLMNPLIASFVAPTGDKKTDRLSRTIAGLGGFYEFSKSITKYGFNNLRNLIGSYMYDKEPDRKIGGDPPDDEDPDREIDVDLPEDSGPIRIIPDRKTKEQQRMDSENEWGEQMDKIALIGAAGVGLLKSGLIREVESIKPPIQAPTTEPPTQAPTTEAPTTRKVESVIDKPITIPKSDEKDMERRKFFPQVINPDDEILEQTPSQVLKNQYNLAKFDWINPNNVGGNNENSDNPFYKSNNTELALRFLDWKTHVEQAEMEYLKQLPPQISSKIQSQFPRSFPTPAERTSTRLDWLTKNPWQFPAYSSPYNDMTRVDGTNAFINNSILYGLVP
jgi:hypothetical protein